VALLALVNAALLPGEPAFAASAPVAEERGLQTLTAPLGILLAAPWGLAFLAYTLGQQIPMGVYDTVWSLYMFHLGAPDWLVGASFATWALPLVLLSPVLGRRTAPERVPFWMILGGGVTALAAATYALLGNPYAVAGVGFLEGVGSAAVVPLSQMYLAARVATHRMAGVQGLAGAVGQGAALVAAVASGYTFLLRPWLPFLMAAVGGVAGTLVFAQLSSRPEGRRALPLGPDSSAGP
jgi:MFS family permease